MVSCVRFLPAILLLLGGCTGSGSATPSATIGPSTTRPAAVTAAGHGTWRSMATPPIPPAGGMAAVWTGRVLVVWGGRPTGSGEGSARGAAYDPAGDRWEALPPAPVAGRFGASAVWTGQEVLFWGGQGEGTRTWADGAAYDPAARRWRVLPDASVGARAHHQAVWTGREMVVWGGVSRCCPVDSVLHDPAAAAYDPVTDRWRTVAPVPALWSGDGGDAVTAVAGDRPLVWRDGRLAAYDAAADRWDEIPGTPGVAPPGPGETVTRSTADPFAVGTAAGDEVFVWSGRTGPLAGVAYRPEPGGPGTWRRAAPLDGQEGAVVVAGGPGRIYAAAGQSDRILEYRVEEDRWRELPDLPVRTRSNAVLAWSGTELLVWGGDGDEGPEGDGARWHCC